MTVKGIMVEDISTVWYIEKKWDEVYIVHLELGEKRYAIYIRKTT